MPVEPVKKIRLNEQLKRFGNGRLPRRILEPIIGGGQLYEPASRFYNLMVVAAEEDGVQLDGVSGGYRSFERQEEVFFERYSPRPTLRRPAVTRIYQGKKYYLKRGKSPSATPGFSPHGWGLAQDINVNNPRVFNWLCKHAPQYGFYLQGYRYLPDGKPNPEWEPWHWQFCNL